MKHRIKYIGIAAVIILAAVLLAGCFWTPAEGSGSLTVDVGSLAGSKSVPAGADTARIYLQQESSGSYFSFDGSTIYTEETISGAGQVTLEGIPAGNWLMIFAVGEKVANGGFYPMQYGTATANIGAGAENTVSVDLNKSTPFEIATDLVGEEITGAVSYGGTVFALDAGNVDLYYGADVSSLDSLDLSTFLSGYTVYSINKGFNEGSGAAVLWINTDKGIVPYDPVASPGAPFRTDFQSVQFPVKESGGFFTPAGIGPSELVIYYRLDDGFGGTMISGGDLGTANWEAYTDFDEYFTGDLVRQFFVYDDGSTVYAYFATSLGAFRLDSDTINDGVDDFVAAADFFEITSGGANVPIYGVAYKDAGEMVMATESGVFVATIDAANIITDVSRIANTEGIKFTRVAVSETGTYIAALTDKAEIYLFKDVGSSFQYAEYPVYTGFPGGVSQLMFVPGTSELFISGEGSDIASGGFVKIDAAAVVNWQ